MLHFGRVVLQFSLCFLVLSSYGFLVRPLAKLAQHTGVARELVFLCLVLSLKLAIIHGKCFVLPRPVGGDSGFTSVFKDDEFTTG